MDDAEEEFGDIREQIFHNNVREQIVSWFTKVKLRLKRKNYQICVDNFKNAWICMLFLSCQVANEFYSTYK